DDYRIEVFGFDDPNRGIVGLRNRNGDFFQPSTPGTRLDTVRFRLDLGPQVVSIVPQPVVRQGGQLTQLRDTIVVYFNGDKLFVENDAGGNPTAGSAENPEFYQLFYTSNTARNTDDIKFTPVSVTYNAVNNTATLKFANDIAKLPSVSLPDAAFRLRIGTRESAPIVPTRIEAAANVISDLNTGGAAKLRLTSKQVGENGGGISVTFINSGSGTPLATAVGKSITVDMGRNNLTAQELVDLLQTSSASSALIDASLEPGSDPNTVVGNRSLSYSPLQLVGLGSTFDTASDLGVIGSDLQTQSSLILASAIDAQPFVLDFPGANDDAGHRQLPQNGNGFEDHINDAFGPDAVAGITTIYYNFRSQYSVDVNGNPLINSITSEQKARAREVLDLWAKYVGVQFVETPDAGLTIALGQLTGLRPIAGTRVQTENALSFGTRIDPTFENSLIVMSATESWDTDYADNFSRRMAAAVGMVLGLEHAGNLPETTLMRLDPTFLSSSGALLDLNDAQLNANDELYEPVFPGNHDILHGQHLYRPDSNDIDLYRFQVDLGAGDRVGLLTAETFAQRLPNSSSLNTNLELFRQVQASASTSLGAGNNLRVEFEAVADGPLGNQLRIFFTQTNRNDSSAPGILVFPNAIGIDLNSNPAMSTTAGEIVDAINNSPAASRLVKARLALGSPSTAVGDNDINQNPVVLTGGRMELVAQNDDYFSDDSILRQSLTSGVYYIGVSASGNDNYNGVVKDSGFGGKSQGEYELRLTFRAAVDTTDAIRDVASGSSPSVIIDGDGDGLPGGVHNFWFETRPLNRAISFSGTGADVDGGTVTVVGASGVQRIFEFTTTGNPSQPGRVAVPIGAGDTSGTVAAKLAAAINAQPALGVSGVQNGAAITLTGERQVSLSPDLTTVALQGRTIFVDKSAGPNADGSLQHPFNNISGNGVPNAFAAAHPGDIVRIVGNGGIDQDIRTVGDNFAYEIGVGLLPGQILSDGATMNVPQGVTTMIDAGAVFKLRQAAINVGSTNLNIDRSGAQLQVLGTPFLIDAQGNALRSTSGGRVSGSVFFTSWLDETIGFDSFSPTTQGSPGDWGGINFRGDVDASAGRASLESEGIFLPYVNHADIRYGGGKVVIDSVQRTVNPIQMLEVRPTITDNLIQFSADAALSALPNSFRETNFHEPTFQAQGAFTSDYDRVGPDLKRNRLIKNSLNGLFIRVTTPAAGTTQTLTVPGRFDDTDVVHLITENLVVSGNPGGPLLDNTVPSLATTSLGTTTGGSLLPGIYNYKLTFVDANGYESLPSDASLDVTLPATENAIQVAGLPAASGDFISRKLYRSQSNGSGPYVLIAELDRATSSFVDDGSMLGGLLVRDRADVSGVTLTEVAGGTLPVGTYNYRIVMVDAAGREGLASNATASITTVAPNSIQLDQLPATLAGYVSRRIYRSSPNGQGPYFLVGELPDSTSSSVTTFVDDGSVTGARLSAETLAVKRPRVNASLVIDPGTVVKLEASRIEATFGATILAEGTDGLPIVFTSRLDDTVGAGGTFDTNNNGAATTPSPRDWGGIYMAPTSRLSVDHARFSYAGGVTRIEGTFRAFNTIEIQQADARIANSTFANNDDGFGGQGPGTRFGRLSNAPATIFVRGAQPALIGNTFVDNVAPAIEIDVNSMTDDLMGDPGRQTGAADRREDFDTNRGPLLRDNRMDNNGLNGLKIRGRAILTTASVWDDTDIVHVVTNEIFVPNVEHEGGLRLQSAPNESLVVKFDGYGSNFNRYIGAGISAIGDLTTGTGRVGGTVHILGQPGFPVILTSLKDDTVGAGLKPDGTPQTDTNNDGIDSIPQPADWRGILLDQYSNDRNVAIALELESPNAAAPGQNATTGNSQFLGDLAGDMKESSEALRLGFTVQGALSAPGDIDVYSFTGVAGTLVWLDIDATDPSSDMVLELLDANGRLLARSDNSTSEADNPSTIFTTSLISAQAVNPLPERIGQTRRSSSGAVQEDGTTNPRDPGFRVLLPGAAGSRSTYFFRVRSAGLDIADPAGGLSDGSYMAQVRLREQQEFPGSTISFADIRYAMNGVHTRGLPGTSPFLGEIAEDESADASFPGSGQQFASNDSAQGLSSVGPAFGSPYDRQTGSRPQYIGNILDTALGGISVAGTISSSDDVDFYRLDIAQEDVVGTVGGVVPVVIDLDYADGFNRADTSINIFREESSLTFFGEPQYRLIYSGDGSNIAEDQPRPLAGTDQEDLSRGSAGNADPYIGPIALAPGTYMIAVSSAAYQPRAKLLNPFDVEPINSIRRIVDTQFVQGVTSADPPVVQNFLPSQTLGAGGEIVSAPFSLGGYTAADLPAVYLDYLHAGGSFDVFVRDASGNETRIATSANNPNLPRLQPGAGSVKMDLASQQLSYNFAGQDGLRLVFRGTNPNTAVDRVIIGFAERGEQIGSGEDPILLAGAFLGPQQSAFTRTFNLRTYSPFVDQPNLVFDYQVISGNLDVFVLVGAQRIRVATTDANNAGPGEVILVTGSLQEAVISLNRWADLFPAGPPDPADIQIEFATRNDNPTAVQISNAHVRLGNGSRVMSNEPNATFAPILVPSTMITTGDYQFEVRLAETFFRSNPFGAPTLTTSWDTNDRLADQTSIIAPAGADITDGDRFAMSDGGRELVFEFNSTGGVGLGNIAISFNAGDPDYVIAQKIRDVINSSAVQSQLKVRAASSGGVSSGSAGTDARLHLFGRAHVRTIAAANAAGEIQVTEYTGWSDRNIERAQGQIIIQNNSIRESRDYGIWSQPAERLPDPRDSEADFGALGLFSRTIIQDKPPLVGVQAVRNLPVNNDAVDGGITPGLVIQNNLLEEGGLGGIKIDGESPIWMITPRFLPSTDNDPTVNNAQNPDHFGALLDDGDYLVIDSDRTRLKFEFEDMAGAGTGNPSFGSGQVEGNGVSADAVPVYYREEGGTAYTRPTPNPLVAFATNGLETMHALRDAILGSIFVTNGTTQQVRATVAQSLLGPDPGAPPSSQTQFYPEYYNRPAVYLEGVTNIQYINTIGPGNPFDIRPLDLGAAPQPHARIVNNTIIGKDGRASYNGEAATQESNDTIADAVQTWQGTSHNPLLYSDVGVIGDGGPTLAGATSQSTGGSSTSGTSGGFGGGGGGGLSTPLEHNGQAIVRFKEGISRARQEQVLQQRGLEIVKEFEFIHALVVRPIDSQDIEQVVRDLGDLPEVVYADPDYIYKPLLVPNDPLFQDQWHYNNTGQTGGTPDADIDLPEAWDTFTGSPDVVMAVVDTGVDYNHPDLRDNIWVNPGEIPGDGIDNDGNGYIDDIHGIDTGAGDSDPMDTHGHGTHVGGTMGAVGNNLTGVSGVNWNSKLMVIKNFTDGPNGGAPISASIEAMNYLAMMKTRYGVNIVVSNNSYGGPGGSQAMSDAIQATIDAGIVFVAAAGNSSLDNDNSAGRSFPASYPLDGIISVAATDHNDAMAGFSNFGLTSVDLAAPGVDVLSTTLGGGYGLNSGTSMASPHVAGVVGLLAGAAPSATVAELKAAILLGADPIGALSGTTVTGARLNAAKSLVVATGGLASDAFNADVDIYQFKLGTGERAIIDIDTANSGLDAVLRIFDSQGVPQEFRNASGVVQTISDNDPAPGEPLSLDPYADFTALKPGVYYAAVSSVGNADYNPLSLADRSPGRTKGTYRISISARHLQDFVITAQDASAYQNGETFTIYGVPDVGSSGSSGVTFEFVFGAGTPPSDPTHIPINIDASWRFPDVARAIAKAINEGGLGRGPAISNQQNLPNGDKGVANPLPPVHAVPLGGLAGVIDAPFNDIVGDRALFLDQFVDFDTNLVSGLGFNKLSPREIERLLNGPFWQINPGLELFTRRFDGLLITRTTTINNNPPRTITISMGNLGIGHDRDSTTPLSFTSVGDGTTEKFVVVKNAAYIDGNGTILVDPDADEGNNLDQLLPETGVLASRGASPTILNNVFFNLQTPVIAEESRRFPLTGGPAPYGTNNPNAVLKPGEVVLGGSIFQYDEPATSNVRFGTGIEQTPTNVPNTALDFNFDIADGTRLFVNGQAGNYLPAPNSPLIDSSIDVLPDRPSLTSVKDAVGIPRSPVTAPDFDLAGQLRVDDPNVAPPAGQGQNVFKDRGAIERADDVGPAAILLNPVDNDALGVDTDPALSVVQLRSGVYSEFRIQLADGNEPTNPFFGLGIDDDTVVSAPDGNRRLPGANVVLFENGRMLVEGIDYTFSYNSTRDEIVLTPLAGVWKQNAVYEMTVNNRDRFALIAPPGDAVRDGDTFTIIDDNGGRVVFEYESGFRLQVPQGLTLLTPLAGGGFGGIADGDRFTITAGSQSVTFEFDRNNNVLSGNVPVLFELGDSQEEITDAIVAAIQGAGLPVTAAKRDAGTIFLGAAAGVRVNTTFSALTQPTTTLALQMPPLGPRPGGVTDGQRFTISDGQRTVTFEYDTDGAIAPGAVAVDISGALTVSDLTDATLLALQQSNLAIAPRILANDLVYIGLSASGSASTGNANIALVGVSRTPAAGQTFRITAGGTSATFEFTNTGTVAPGNIPVLIAANDDQDTIAGQIVTAINSAGIGLSPVHVGDGNIVLGGAEGDSVDVSGAPSLGLFGQPGVRSNSRMTISGPVILTVPSRGAGDIVENSTFSIIANGRLVTFEFDSDFSGPSAPGNVVVLYDALSTRNDIAASIVSAINGSSLGITAVNLGNGQLSIGNIPTSNVNLGNSNLTLSQAVATDGETFTISNGTTAVTFEFEDVDRNNGFDVANVPIRFSFSTSTVATLGQAIKAAVESVGLGLSVTILPDGRLEFNATPTHTFDLSGAPSLSLTGVPGGANPVLFIQDPSFTGDDMKRAIITAITDAPNTPLVATDRGGDTLFVENAITIDASVESFFLRGVADVAGNNLKANRINNETQFTILMPGVVLDYGDAPDPVQATPGRYPTLHVSDGARHVVTTSALLGSTITPDLDGQPTAAADGDVDDGVSFGTNLNVVGAFNPNVFTSIDVTLSSPGFVDAWIDFNSDGDWDDPGEQVINSARFDSNRLTRTFLVTVPATTPMPNAPTTTYARFRSSTNGGLTPTGLAVNGEVEDYTVTLIPGTPPTAVDDQYTINEDTVLTTTDATGTATPSFTIDDGMAANDVDPDGDPLRVEIVDPPQVGTLTLTDPANPDGTFTYTPPADFNGTVTFTYRVNDGLLSSNNLGTVTITVREVNDAPIAADDTLSVDEDQQLDIDQSVLTANDQPGPNGTENGQTLTVTSVDAVSQQGGTVTLAGGRVIYTPPTDYSGPDQFTYTVTDNGTTAGIPAPLSATATVFLTVRDQNDPPTAGGDNLTTTEDTPVSVPVANLLANDVPGPADESAQTLTFIGVSAQSAAGGTVVSSGGIVTYTPPADFSGTDTFEYIIEDDGTSGGQPDPRQSTGTVTVTVTPVNDAPTVRSPFGLITMDEDDPARVIVLSDVFFDPDVATAGDNLSYQIVSNSNPGLVSPAINGGQLELQLVADQNGQALVEVRAIDQAGLSVTDTLTLTVNPVNDAPRLAQSLPDLSVNEDAPPPQLVLTPQFFFDPDVALNGDQLTFSVVSNSNPVLVTPTINGDTLTLNLTANQSGVAIITVSATDLSGQTISDTFRLVVNPVNDPPETQPDFYSVKQGETLETTDPRGLIGDASDDGVLANDSDPENDALTAQLVDPPQFASLFALRPDGTFTYRHDFARGRTTDTFTYRALDGQGASAVTTVTITIDPPPPPPHQNPAQNLDVNADGFVSPIDALLIINFLNNNNGGGSVVGLPAPPPYRDVNGDNFISPIDALIVINALNSNAGGEGESPEGDLWAGAVTGQVIAAPSQTNVPVLMQPAEGEATDSVADAFADLGRTDTDQLLVDTTWVTERRMAQGEDDAALPTDLALEELLGGMHDGN
ncbi:MAG: tandem-95 repeat protein, partial [Planctomycetota bacterium]